MAAFPRGYARMRGDMLRVIQPRLAAHGKNHATKSVNVIAGADGR
jgi:hypothetical protein